MSNVPAQALILMNSPFVVEQARRWAEQALADGGQTAESRVTRLYLSALGRPARPEELSEALEFLAAQSQRHGRPDNDVQSWADLCHVLLNVKEFIYVH